MNVLVLVLHFIISAFIIAVVLLQPSKTEGLSSAISGGAAETFFGKNKARTYEGKLSKLTTIAMVAFVVTSMLLLYFSNK